MSFSCALQRAALRALSVSGLPKLFAGGYSGIGAILAFHRVGHVAGKYAFASRRSSIEPNNLSRVIQDLRERQYEFVTMDEAVRRIENPAKQKRKFVVLTFDDGFVDTYTGAFQICRAFNVPMVVYLIAGVLARNVPVWWLGLEQLVADAGEIEFRWHGSVERIAAGTALQKRRAYFSIARRLSDADPETCSEVCARLSGTYGVDFSGMTARQALTAEMIHEMRASGLVEFGAHTVSHANLRRLDLIGARREMAESRQYLENCFGLDVRHFAYPYGAAHACGPREFRLCRELGFLSGVTTRMDTTVPEDREHIHALPRLTFNGEFQDTPLLELLLSGTLPRVREAMRVWESVRARSLRTFAHSD